MDLAIITFAAFFSLLFFSLSSSIKYSSNFSLSITALRQRDSITVSCVCVCVCVCVVCVIGDGVHVCDVCDVWCVVVCG